MGAVAIYGATSSIGMSVAKKFITTGTSSSVHLIARNLIKLDPFVQQLTDQFTQVSIQKHFCDVLDEKSIQDSAKSIRKISMQERQELDSVIFCVGIRRDQLLIKSTDEDLRCTLESNLLAAMRVCRHVCRQLISQKSGSSIVLVGSVVGEMGNVGQSSYAASKAGLKGLTRSLAMELAPKNITVNLVSPGYVDTNFISDLNKDKIKDQVPLARIGKADEIASCVYFLATNPLISGQNLIVDGGMSLWADKIGRD